MYKFIYLSFFQVFFLASTEEVTEVFTSKFLAIFIYYISVSNGSLIKRPMYVYGGKSVSEATAAWWWGPQPQLTGLPAGAAAGVSECCPEHLGLNTSSSMYDNV